jgi:hypothetical protein
MRVWLTPSLPLWRSVKAYSREFKLTAVRLDGQHYWS